MKILIMGASGVGTTTLGQTLAKRTSYTHLDVDNYYWKPTTPPFQEKVPLVKRNQKLTADFNSLPKVIVSGSLISWGNEWLQAFDLVVFLYLPPKIRMERLRQREIQRHGEALHTHELIRQTSQAFLEWAAQYDDPAFTGRSLAVHQQWLQKLTCPILRLEGAIEFEQKITKVMALME
ncbi:AAA family ATPase [uncultured Microscilla sp.]|uniref:AAA family ATPase n=1 Tax=uncultured Microscilla sp. TaxID=432653 RepID=UPI0026266948|nr:AAA family ATPase [uncultured Microscilla sp.]